MSHTVPVSHAVPVTGTAVPVTRLVWETGPGYDPDLSATGKTLVTPHTNRQQVLGMVSQDSLTLAQWICPICVSRLLTEHGLSTTSI